MSLINNVKESVTWIAGAALEPAGKLLKLDIGGAIGAVLRIPFKILQGGLALFGKSTLQTKAAAQEAMRQEWPNGSPGYF